MAYYGNQPIAGETNSFKVLDDISSYTKTFDGSSAAVVSTSDDTLTFYDHRFIQGQRVTYGKGSGGTVVTGLTDATVYYVIRQDKDTIQLATSASNAATLTAVDLTGVGGGTAHELTVAFDGTNTKFKATTGGIHIKLTRPGQLMISMNGVIQEPQNNTPTNGFGIESNNVIVFSTAPTVLDTFWGHYLTSNLSSWEMSDNKIDNFTGNGSTTTYTLSKTPANADNILVTIDGVTQYPSDSTTTRSYTLDESVVTFTSAPALNAAIAVRHIGYAGGSGGGSGGGGVTGFYGRTGNVKLIRSDLQNTDINLKNLTGVAATFTGNVSIGGTLTYTDVTNIDSIGIVTAQSGVHFGIGATSGKFEAATGITTFSTSVGIADSIHHVGNTDTSIRFPADDTFTLETAGDERLRIDSDGKIGMGVVSTSPGGTCNPDGNQLLIRGASTFQTTKGHIMLTGDSATVGQGPQIVFSESGSGGNFAGAYIGHVRTGGNSQGDLVFGTRNIAGDTNTVPSERLRINSDGAINIGSNPAQATGTNTQNAILTVKGYPGGNESSAAILALIRGYNTTSATADHTIGRIVFGDKQAGEYAFIEGEVEANGAVGDTPGRLVFSTAPDGTSAPTEKLRITSDGRIGINDPSPNDYEVDILKRSTATDAQIRLYNNETGSSNDTVMRYQIGGTTANNYIYFGDGDDTNVGQIRYSHNSNFLSIHTNATERLRIDSSGQITNTGIATSYVTTMFAANFAKLDLRGTNIANSNHYLLSYGEGHANDHDFHMVNTIGSLVFRTGSSSPTERLSINSNGKFCFGTQNTNFADNDSIVSIVNAASAGTENPLLTLWNPTTVGDARAGIDFLTNAQHGTGRDGAFIRGSNDGVTAKANIQFGTIKDESYVETLRLDTSGNLVFSNNQHITINNSYTNGSMTIGANVGTSAYTSIKGSSYVRAENYVSTGSATWLERWKVYQHGTVHQPTRHGDSIESKGGGIYYVINGATPLDGDYDDNTYTPLMRCGHSFNGVMYIWMAFNGTEFHNGCRQQIIDCQGTYGYVSNSIRKSHNQNALGAGLNSLEFAYQNSGSPNYYFKVRGTWASGQNQPYILWTWVGHNSEYPYAL